MKLEKRSLRPITVRGTDRALLSGSHAALRKDTDRLKKAYLSYITEEFKKVDIGYPLNEVGDLVYELSVSTMRGG